MPTQQDRPRVLVTGGAGYIGSHMVVALQQAGYTPVVLDNFSNARPDVFRRIEQITGEPVCWRRGDIRDADCLDQLFSEFSFELVAHFAGLKAAGESLALPLSYYHNNVVGSLQLIEAMQRHCCKRLVFSSSATVYGAAVQMPVTEQAPLGAMNPYGQSKLVTEQMLRDICAADSGWQVALLRYFNPVGAHESGLIGEDPTGVPGNLLPVVAQVAVGRLREVQVFGDDYDTPDGTGVRDYIHVMDLVEGHLCAMQALTADHGCVAYNLGTGRGHSVLEVVEQFARISGQSVPLQVVNRRPGDIGCCYADPAFSARQLGWQAKRDLPQMIADHWRWQQRNPQGFHRRE